MLAMLCCVFSKGCQSILAKGFRKQRNLPKKLSYLVVPKNRQPCMSNTCRCEPGSSAKSCEVEVLDVTVQREENPLWGNWCNQSIERTLSFLSNPFSYYSWTIFLGLGKGDVYHCRCAQFLGAFTPNFPAGEVVVDQVLLWFRALCTTKNNIHPRTLNGNICLFLSLYNYLHMRHGRPLSFPNEIAYLGFQGQIRWGVSFSKRPLSFSKPNQQKHIWSERSI